MDLIGIARTDAPLYEELKRLKKENARLIEELDLFQSAPEGEKNSGVLYSAARLTCKTKRTTKRPQTPHNSRLRNAAKIRLTL